MKADRDRRIIGFVFIMLLAVSGVVYAAIPQNTLRHNAGIVFPTVNATQGYYVGANQIIDAARAAAFVTLDTGQGANELYDMDQNVLTTSDVNFSSVEADDLYVRGSYNVTQLAMYPQQPASYIIWRDGSTYYAKNGTTGAIDYSGADAATVIQAALNALHPTYGGTVYIAPGIYLIYQPLVMPICPFILRGGSIGATAGVEGTCLKLADGAECEIIQLSVWSSFSLITDLYLDGNRDNQVGDHYVIHAVDAGARDTWLQRLFIRFGSNTVVYVESPLAAIWNMWIDNVMVENNDYGAFKFVATEPITRSWIINCFVYSSSPSVLLHGANCLGVGVSDGYFLSRIELFSCQHCRIVDNTIDVPTSFGVSINGNALDTIISDNTFPNLLGTGTYAITIVAGDYLNIRGNDVRSYATPFDITAGQNTHGIINSNIGYITENSGTATLWNLTSSITVPHDLSYTPTAGDISVTPITNLSNCTQYWFDTIGAANFVIHVGDAGAEKNTAANIVFAWSVDRH